MNDLLNKPGILNRIEFWAVTTIFIFAVFFHITYILSDDWAATATAKSIPFNYFFISRLARYIVLYGAYLVLNFIVVPRMVKKQAILQNALLIITIFVTVAITFGITDTYLRSYLLHQYSSRQDAYNFIFQNSFLYTFWLLLLFGFYSLIKYAGLYLLSPSETIPAKYKVITPGGFVLLMLWMIVMLCMITGNADQSPMAIVGTIIPCAIIFYWYSFFSLIPKSLSKKKPFRAYLLRTVLVLIIAAFPIALLTFLLCRDDNATAAITSLNLTAQLLITAPLSWFIFKRYMQGNEEIYFLKKELGQSHASFDFLRSQINPHFLFNALNTIYGTALQEGAEKTSEGVEKLGDMMRFMLQENMQEKIALAREIDYLNNYISLQKLRTDPNPNIIINTQIEKNVNSVHIAPMLLIPFVENAFKHGISFREQSHIKVSLELKDKELFFDVHNSKHAKQENDPEKNNTGIGLKNVRQRLQLLYPNKHELIIRETGKDFFVHLTIQLT